MSIQNLLDGIALAQKHPEKVFFAGPRSESLVRAAEERLGVNFPQTYRQFLLRLGAGNFGSAEFYGVITNNFETGTVPNGIWYTLSERNEIALPQELVVVGTTSYGELYCIDTSIKPEGPIIIYQSQLGPDEQPPRETVAEDFGDFFLQQINQRLAIV